MIEPKPLEPVLLTDVWKKEATDFTPWLAKKENIDFLGEVLGIPLVVESTEESVGKNRADIVCINTADQSRVLIENQIRPSDHSHIGQVITYAAGLTYAERLDAVTVVWIAKRIKSGHREAIDWLNEFTSDTMRFFALEIELWKIGTCGPAHNFNVVAMPKGWTRPVRGSSSVRPTLNDAQDAHLSFWTQFVNTSELPWCENKVPGIAPWLGTGIGSGASLRAMRLTGGQPHLRAFLYLRGDYHTHYFAQLMDQRSEIEAELGFQVSTEQTDKASTIQKTAENNPHDEDDWPNQIQWFKDKLTKFDKAFRPRLQEIKKSGGLADDD